MNIKNRRQNKIRKFQKKVQQDASKKKSKTKNELVKSFVTTFLIWGLVIVNLFLIASFVSRFWETPSSKKITGTSTETSNELDETQTPATLKPTIQVEVLNGCGAPGVGKQITNFLRDHGFDVVNVGNYDNFNVNYTYAIDRKSLDKIYANEVAKSMGIKLETGVAAILNSEKILHVSIVIGHDYKDLVPFK